MAAGAPLLGVPAERVTTPEWFAGASAETIALVAGLGLTGANLLAGGLILLLAGLSGLPLSQPRVRAGAVRKLAGANLLILCFAYIALTDYGSSLEHTAEDPWIAVPAIVLFLIAARVGIRTIRAGWKYEARSADDVLRDDPRPPVLYLRSFRDDAEIVVAGSDRLSARIDVNRIYAAFSPEQELAMILDRVGPVVAIGKPGERLPELGAARRQVGDNEWRETVDDYMRRARLIVIRAGTTDGLWWEIERAVEHGTAGKVLLVSLGHGPRAADFDERFEARYGTPRHVDRDEPRMPGWLLRLIRLVMPLGVPIGRVICFDAQQVPFAIPVRFRLTLPGLALAPYRPYREALAATMRQVFQVLGLPWERRPAQTTAVLLALFGGIVGAHHFYLGRRRRAWLSVLFAPIGVPIILSWIDAIRMTLLDERTFADRFGSATQSGSGSATRSMTSTSVGAVVGSSRKPS